MIAFFRKKLHTPLFRTVIWIVFISMAIMIALPTLIKNERGASWIARINGDPIEYKEFVRRMESKQVQLELMRYQFEQMGIPFDPTMLGIHPQQWALSSLIEDRLLDQVARTMHFGLDDEQIAYRLSDPYFIMQELSDFIPAYFAMSSIELNSTVLNKLLKEKGASAADFDAFVEQSLRRKLVKDIVSDGAYVPEIDIRNEFIHTYVPKKFSILTFSRADVLAQAKKNHIKEEEIKKYFEEHSSDYMVPEKRSATIWEFTPHNYGISVTDEEMKSFYDQNKQKYQDKPTQIKVRHILFKVTDPALVAAVRGKADALLQELTKSPETFAQKAKELSNSDDADKGGLTDYFGRSDKESAFSKAAFSLKENNEISPVIQTSQGFEIIQRIDRKPATYKSLPAVNKEIKDMLMNQKFRHQFAQDMSARQEKFNADVASIKDFAHSKHAHEKDLHHVTAQANQKLFGIKKKNEFIHFKEDGKELIMVLTAIDKAYKPAFESIKHKVIEDMHDIQAQQLLESTFNKARQKLSVRFDEVAQEFGGHIKTTGWIKSNDTKAIERLNKENLPITQMLQMENVGFVLPYYQSGDAYLIKLDELGEVEKGLYEAKRGEIYNELLRRNKALVLNSFIASLNRNATIETNQKILQETNNE